MAAETRVFLTNIRWSTYEALLADVVNKPGTRFAYDDGDLEIMQVQIGHEHPNRTLASVIGIIGEETDRDLLDIGSTTLRRKDLSKGIEPDPRENAPAWYQNVRAWVRAQI